MRRRIEGPDAVLRAVDEGAPVRLVLVRASGAGERVAHAVDRARRAGAEIREVTPAVLRRFSGGAPADVLALVGPPVEAELAELMARDGAVWLLSGVGYPGNAGFAIRTAEVSGAAGIVIDAEFTGRGRRAAERASMQAHRLLPVLWESTEAAVAAARAAGRRVLVLEDAGGEPPSRVDLSGNPLLVVGGEHAGHSADVLATADGRVCVPMAGFIPSYNLQAAMAAVAARLAETERMEPGDGTSR